MKYSYDLNGYYSTKFADWESHIVKEYQRFNDALGSVQDQFIVGHKQIANQVYQTIFENELTITVNYSEKTYISGELVVPALDFVVVKGGSQK